MAYEYFINPKHAIKKQLITSVEGGKAVNLLGKKIEIEVKEEEGVWTKTYEAATQKDLAYYYDLETGKDKEANPAAIVQRKDKKSPSAK